MLRRRCQLLLILLNLLALNAYALTTVAVGLAAQEPSRQMHLSCDHSMQDCDMPCCKGQHGKSHHMNLDQCACKTGTCVTIQLQSVSVFSCHYNPGMSTIEPMPTNFIPQDRSQRLLRPPIH